MPRITPITLLSKPASPALVIRSTLAVQELPGFIGQSFTALQAHVQSLGKHPADIPFLCFDNEDLAALQATAGFQTPSQLPGTEQIQSVILPPTTVVTCMYQGPYGPLQEPVYAEMSRWIQEHSLTPLGPILEQYYNGQEVSEDLYLTAISIQVK